MLTDFRLEDIKCGKYQLVFASAGNISVKPFFSHMKDTATPFYQSMPVCVKQIMARKTSSAVIYDSKYRLRSFGRKNRQIDERQLYSRILVWNI